MSTGSIILYHDSSKMRCENNQIYIIIYLKKIMLTRRAEKHLANIINSLMKVRLIVKAAK